MRDTNTWPLLIACLASMALGSCVEVASPTETIALETHVTDWRDEVIYQVLVDRFANGDLNNDYNVNLEAPARYHGGDWQGLIDRLGYLEALGVTALWISPVVKNVEEDAGVSGYHGYWTQDFGAVNPHFGDMYKLRELVDACHARGMKVILDIVTNHVGQLFYYDINGNGQPDEAVFGGGDGTSPVTHVSEYDPDFDPQGIQSETSLGQAGPAEIRFFHVPELNRMPPEPPEFQNPDWYNRMGRVWDWNHAEQVLLGDFPGGLKDLKTTHPDVRTALIEAFARWVEIADFDGFRIDTLKHVEHDFWEEFCPAIRARLARHGKTNFFLFGEAFDGDDALIGSFTFNGGVDSVFQFAQKFQIYDDVFKYGAPTQKVADLLALRGEHYGTEAHPGGVVDAEGNGLLPTQVLVNFIENHDIPRFLYDAPDLAAFHSALFHLLTFDGIPSLYYGSEQEFSGGNDPHNREDLWDTGYATDGATFEHIARLTALRRELAPLRRGNLTLRWTTSHVSDEEDAGILAFERAYAGKTVLVVLNVHDSHVSRTATGVEAMATSFPEGTVLRDVFAATEETFTVGQDGRVDIATPPRTGRILVPDGE